MPTKFKKQLHHLILDSLPVALVTMDFDLKITLFNTRAEKLTGYSFDEAVGRPCCEILNSDFCEDDCPLEKDHDYSESSSGLETEIINRQGSQIPVRISATPIFDKDHNFISYIEVIEDISRAKRMEREKSNYINTIAHDINASSIGIRGLIRRLRKKKICHTNKILQQYLRVLNETALRMESIVREFVEHSRLESGQVQLVQGEIDLENILKQVIEIHQIRAEEYEITLTYDCKPLSPILADESLLHRAFTNIINNAIKYSPKHSEITISTQETDRELFIYFRDHGRGIKPEEIPYIFDAFYRSESIDDIRGHGLGLAAARAIIRLHGGKISVESIVAKGSLFTVHLPKKHKFSVR